MLKNALPGGIMSKVGYEHNTNKGGGIEYYIDRGYVPFHSMINNMVITNVVRSNHGICLSRLDFVPNGKSSKQNE